MDYSLPGSSVHGISQARILEWVATPFSRESSQLGDGTPVLHCRWILYCLSHLELVTNHRQEPTDSKPLCSQVPALLGRHKKPSFQTFSFFISSYPCPSNSESQNQPSSHLHSSTASGSMVSTLSWSFIFLSHVNTHNTLFMNKQWKWPYSSSQILWGNNSGYYLMFHIVLCFTCDNLTSLDQ